MNCGCENRAECVRRAIERDNRSTLEELLVSLAVLAAGRLVLASIKPELRRA